jgi:hypothetical protein
VIASVLFLVGVTVASAASAEPRVAGSSASQAAGAPALSRAREAWKRSEVVRVEAEARSALQLGELAAAEVVEAYALLGCALVELRRRPAALEAFRTAALLDGKFSAPQGASKGALYVAEAMRKEKSKYGSIEVRAEAPAEASAGRAFTVVAAIDEPHLALVASVHVSVSDPLSGKSFDDDAAPAARMKLVVPASITLPGASLFVRVQALDTHKNRLGEAEQRVRVEGIVVATTNGAHKETLRDGEMKDKSSGRGGGFWSTAWPYVIGGFVLAGAGTGIYFGVRPADTVGVGPARAQTIH